MECGTCGNSLVEGTCLACAARAAPPISPGETIDGRWTIESLLATGGMGAVYRAREPALARTVAIKFLVPGGRSHRAAIDRFLEEARQTAALSHPNIVAIHAVGERRGMPFMVMEYLDGEPLSERLKKGPLSPAETVAVTAQVISALELLRTRGLVHRDIKPSNIVVDASGHATLLDFGLSRKQVRDGAAHTASGVVVGTPGYLAPERILGVSDVDHRSDLYSLALVVFELLTGRRAIVADHPAALLSKQLEAPPLDPRSVKGDLPAALAGFFAVACARDPARRHPDGRTFLRALEESLGLAPPGASTSTTLMAPAPRPGRRWLIATAIVVAVAGGAALALVLSRPAERTPAVVLAAAPEPPPREPSPAEPAQLEAPAEPDGVRNLELPAIPVQFGDPRRHLPPAAHARPTPPAASPPAPIAPAQLTVLARAPGGPRWANVYVDGQPRGSTPARLEVPPGRHTLLVERNGVRSAPRQVTGVAGSVVTVTFELAE